MAAVSILYRYCYLLVVFSSLMCLPLCYSGKMRRKPKHDGILRSMKILDRKFNRRVQQASTPEEFLKIFNPKVPQEAMADSTGLIGLRVADDNMTINEMAEVYLSIQQTSCAVPKPVLLDTHDVLGINKGRLQWVMPPCVEVNRCGAHSGCCRETEICSVKEGSVRNVTKTVLVGTVELLTKQPRHRPRTIEIEEHTECECRLKESCKNLNCRRPHKKDMQRCTCICPKLCPQPYIHNDTCGCKCSQGGSENAGKCWKIYRGKKEMDEDACRCVNSGQCHPPTCRSRYIFNNETCMCVRKPSTSERTIDQYGALFQAELNVRATENARPTAIPFGIMVRSRHQFSDSKKVLPESPAGHRGNPKLGSLSPDEANGYKHSSHTSYNDTIDHNGKRNITRKTTKTKISTLVKSGDELNATFIKDEHTIEAVPNGTEHATVYDPVISEETNTQVIPNALPERQDISYAGEYVVNEYEEEESVDSVGTNVDDLKLFSSASSVSSIRFSWSYEDKSENTFVSEFRTPNGDQENYEYDGSGDNDLGAY